MDPIKPLPNKEKVPKHHLHNYKLTCQLLKDNIYYRYTSYKIIKDTYKR